MTEQIRPSLPKQKLNICARWPILPSSDLEFIHSELTTFEPWAEKIGSFGAKKQSWVPIYNRPTDSIFFFFLTRGSRLSPINGMCPCVDLANTVLQCSSSGGGLVPDCFFAVVTSDFLVIGPEVTINFWINKRLEMSDWYLQQSCSPHRSSWPFDRGYGPQIWPLTSRRGNEIFNQIFFAHICQNPMMQWSDDPIRWWEFT